MTGIGAIIALVVAALLVIAAGVVQLKASPKRIEYVDASMEDVDRASRTFLAAIGDDCGSEVRIAFTQARDEAEVPLDSDSRERSRFLKYVGTLIALVEAPRDQYFSYERLRSNLLKQIDFYRASLKEGNRRLRQHEQEFDAGHN